MVDLPPLTDNSVSEKAVDEPVLVKIKPYAGKKLKDLHEKFPDLLIFPPVMGDNDDDIGSQPLFSLDEENKIRTGNLLGFFGVNGVSFVVRSRFDDSDKQLFLHHMLKKVFGHNILNLPTKTKGDNLWDLYYLLFPYCLKNALRQGLFKTYRRFSYNDSHLRGTVDVVRHLRNNIPFAGRFAYQTRERTTDNPLIQLVRHTIEFIRANAATAPVLREKETAAAVNDVVAATPTYAIGDRAKVIAQNLRPVRHPYFTDYTVLQKVCLKILRREKLSFHDTGEKLHGIVFDGAWLWEEYLATVLKDKDFTHARNKTKENGIPVYDKEKEGNKYNQYTVYPDFYKKEDTVIDAKYKRLDKSVCREDRFQLIFYMHILNAAKGFLVYPIQCDDNTTIEDEGNINDKRIRFLNGCGGTIGRLPFHIPKDETNFEQQMGEATNAFLKDLDETSR